jgi:hydrocephalus-inducing protein
VLRPTQETIVDVNFRAIEQKEFLHVLNLEVEDNEDIGVKQEPMLKLNIQAEAFKIDVQLDAKNPENLLNFGDVRVGDSKEQQLPIKNIGKYDIQYRFVMKKKLFRDNFKIEPTEGTIKPNEEKMISFKFESEAEIRKLKTTNATTDIMLEILEGKSLETFNTVPINVAVNSVFSKYSITPLRNINFGPIQFNDQRTRQFEVKNEGIFEFNFLLFDYADDAKRNEIRAQEKADREAAKAAKEAEEKGGKAKKDTKKKDVKPPKKDAGKKGDPHAGALKIGQWIFNPPLGTVAPDSSQTVEVTF